ncbi:hypothetical protein ACT17_05320 [Mycolicibacterium conceptionense]|jgi:uncharacterized protein YecE (DUF72 family)|uniref:Sensor histidine kinase n=2 Tax=Mycolicibacterium TaxID=1866885 RepID=A0ABR5FQP0_9MYCO|nr:MULTISPECIES: DUF72 domain-containing protein [Mycolicibacterium]KLI07054.1 hypothetical protein AA982_16130 [Mycolicibacterium senegalense]KLO50263.1 hypothetical protein ABW05_00740 [Mycolicibacterium senegalense]KMV19490.1 hypothetical protein ACT17_05320 [Mycolicibacterium conceptionense]OBK03847.1 hypothetical protein A5639_22430 [Mycolicibacterium conceptionense]OMB68565.1 hypothetical protein A5741_09690 [Mycolicibacterium conceptionense]
MIRIGTSGWSYDHWTDVLYPRGTPAKSRLAHYVDEFDTVELNGSFYRWPADTTFTGWRDQMPDGFTMSVKAHRGLTHYRRLRSPESWTPRFADYWKLLGPHNEALLVQLHPALERDDDLLDAFLSQLPRPVQVAMELRHPSWDAPPVYGLLERHGAAYVVMSGPGLTCRPVATSDLVYLRMHGPGDHGIYAGRYSDDELCRWAEQIRDWDQHKHRVVVYFNNDLGGHAVRNARKLKQLLSGE